MHPPDRGLSAIADADLAEDGLDVNLYGGLGNIDLSSD